ncbi:MAG TPA: hypothetical protein VHA09_08400 [Nitrososphaera sp.]|nr:hypothetical protein [Nitrososphaera sp.]
MQFVLEGRNDDDSVKSNGQKTCRLAAGKDAIVLAAIVLTISFAGIGSTSIMQANAAQPPIGGIIPKLPPRACTATLNISSPTNGANYFENERAPGNDGFVTIKFSGSYYNPCRPVFTSLKWYLDGKFLGSGDTVYKTLFAGCESYTTHTATLVATLQVPPAKAINSVATLAPANSMSKSVSFTTGIVC